MSTDKEIRLSPERATELLEQSVIDLQKVRSMRFGHPDRVEVYSTVTDRLARIYGRGSPKATTFARMMGTHVELMKKTTLPAQDVRTRGVDEQVGLLRGYIAQIGEAAADVPAQDLIEQPPSETHQATVQQQQRSAQKPPGRWQRLPLKLKVPIFTTIIGGVIAGIFQLVGVALEDQLENRPADNLVHVQAPVERTQPAAVQPAQLFSEPPFPTGLSTIKPGTLLSIGMSAYPPPYAGVGSNGYEVDLSDGPIEVMVFRYMSGKIDPVIYSIAYGFRTQEADQRFRQEALRLFGTENVRRTVTDELTWGDIDGYRVKFKGGWYLIQDVDVYLGEWLGDDSWVEPLEEAPEERSPAETPRATAP